jgi:hypothetical protein
VDLLLHPGSMKLNTLLSLFFLSAFTNVAMAGIILKPTDTLGVKIASIAYKIKVGKADSTFTDGLMPWMGIENPAKELDSLVDANETVLQFAKATLVIDYPLTKPATFEVTSTGKGFTRKQLILLISEKYHQIYKDEEKTSATTVTPVDKRQGVVNRNNTVGKYGICCHDLGDLVLDSIEVLKNDNGNVSLILEIES